MAHPILTENAEWARFNAESAALEKRRADAVAAYQRRVLAHHDAVLAAMVEKRPYPEPPQPFTPINDAIRAEQAKIDQRRVEWLAGADSELVEAAYERADEIKADVARAGDTLDASKAELQLLYSMLLHLARKAGRPAPTIAPTQVPADLIAVSRSSRNPLRWDEPATVGAG